MGSSGHRPEARLRRLWAFSPGWLVSLADIHSWRSGLVRRRLCRADGAAALHPWSFRWSGSAPLFAAGLPIRKEGTSFCRAVGMVRTAPPRILTVVRVMAREPERREGRPAAGGCRCPGGALSAHGRPLPWDRLGGWGQVVLSSLPCHAKLNAFPPLSLSAVRFIVCITPDIWSYLG